MWNIPNADPFSSPDFVQSGLFEESAFRVLDEPRSMCPDLGGNSCLNRCKAFVLVDKNNRMNSRILQEEK